MLSNFLSHWDRAVWQVDIIDLPRWQRFVYLSVRGTQVLISDLLTGHNTLYAKGLVYMSILSLVPLLAVMFSVLKGFGVHNQLQPLLLQFLTPLGAKGVEITTTILSFVDNIKVGVLGAVGLGVLMFTVFSLIQQIETAFNSTWRVKHLRPVLDRFSHYISVLLVGPVLIFSSIGLSQSVQKMSLFQATVGTETGAFVYSALSVYLPFFMTVLAISFVYMFVPNTRVKATAALFGGTIAALLFKVATSVFTLFIVGSTKYDAIYSAFATIIILFIWIFIVWLILLLGSSIAFYFQHLEKLQYIYRDEELSPYESEGLALQIMVLVTKRYYSDQPPLPQVELSRQLHIPDDLVENMISHLEKGGYITAADSSQKTYVPASPPEETSVSDLLAYIHDSDSKRVRPEMLNIEKNVNLLLKQAESHALLAIRDISIKQLAISNNIEEEFQT